LCFEPLIWARFSVSESCSAGGAVVDAEATVDSAAARATSVAFLAVASVGGTVLLLPMRVSNVICFVAGELLLLLLLLLLAELLLLLLS
jgi:hypothetical protein